MELDLDNLAAVRVLGMGAMGTVFLAAGRSPSGPPLFALKVVDKSHSPAKPGADRRARWEVSVLSRLSHPFLPSLLGRVETPDFLAWAVPYCAGGDLNALRYSQTDGVFSPSAIRFYLSEILLALAHLHSLGIVYRDLKPENVLIQASGHVTLTDFDLSCYLPPRPAPSPPTSPTAPPPLYSPEKPGSRRLDLTRLFSAAPVLEGSEPTRKNKTKKATKSARVSPASRRRAGAAAGERSNSFVGTEEYVSPEVVRGDGHEFAVDWWALGVLAYEMAYGRTPFRGRNRKETFANILTRRPEFAGGQRSDLTDLVERLLAKDPTQRLGFHGGAEEVKAHPFFGGVRWNLLTEVARPPFLVDADDLDEQLPASVSPAGGSGGFTVGDYFKKLRRQQQQQASPPPSRSPSSTSFSLTDF